MTQSELETRLNQALGYLSTANNKIIHLAAEKKESRDKIVTFLTKRLEDIERGLSQDRMSKTMKIRLSSLNQAYQEILNFIQSK